MTLGMLIEGKWVTGWTERDAQGRFKGASHFGENIQIASKPLR